MAAKRITIAHDNTYAKFVGKTADGRQFFLTTPFVPSTGNTPRHEFLALYLFDKDGKLAEAKILDLGPRKGLKTATVQTRKDELFTALGTVKFGSIRVLPFTVPQFGQTFGLTSSDPEDPGETQIVLAMPGAYMEFSPPWNSGYDTFEEPDKTELLLLRLS